MEEKPIKKFTHLAVKPLTQRKVAILSAALDVDIYSLVEFWADAEWKTAHREGLVTDAMIKGQVEKSKSKVSETHVSEICDSGRKPLRVKVAV